MASVDGGEILPIVRPHIITKRSHNKYIMRKDIQVNTKTSDIVLVDTKHVFTYSFQWLGETDLYLEGKIIIPFTLDIDKLYSDGIRIPIAYTPVYKHIRIKIVRDFGGGLERAIVNPTDNSEWFEVLANLHQQKRQIYASQLSLIDTDIYLITLKDGQAWVWSGKQLDVHVINANIQNRNLLLQCVPSNSYRYPTTGVGLVRYLHANIDRSDLAERLDSEFKADKVKVISAAFNSDTGDLDMELDFSEADASI